MSSRKFKILIFPEGTTQVRHFQLNLRVFQVFCYLFFAFMVVVGLMLFDYWCIRSDREELFHLRSENQVYGQEIKKLSANLESLRQDMVVLAQNDAHVRVMTKLSVEDIKNPVGIGGPAEEDTLDDVSRIQEEIDQIQLAINLRRKSQEEIRGLFNDQQSLLSATPKGWPIKGWLTSLFGMRKSPFSGRQTFHAGLDIAARTGTPVTARADGVVSFAGIKSGYGKLVVIDHGYGYQTYYGHNSKIFIKVGQSIKSGDKISAVGNTGRSTGPHLHYEVRLNNLPVNPKKFL